MGTDWGQVLPSNMRDRFLVVVLAAVIPAGAHTAPRGEPQAEVLEGTRAGVTGTPAYFSNRRLVSCA